MIRSFVAPAAPTRTLTLALAFLAGAAAADFPPITEAEKALTKVPHEPNAPAVVLFDKGTFRMETVGKLSDSVFTVRTRIKILTEEGEKHGEISVFHSNFRRLKYLRGRTVLPDGRVLELSDDDKFERRSSLRHGFNVTVAAFPGVEPGAILDYEYELVYQSIFRLRPWHFQARIPTLHSEITYVVPEHIGFRPWVEVRAWMDDMPAIPEEPFSFPFADLSNQFMILPNAYVFGNRLVDLNTSWERVCDDIQTTDYYDHQKRAGNAKQKARELAAAAGGDRRDQTAAVYRFVRDQIQRVPLIGIFVRRGASVDSVLSEGRGDEADQALVLQSMLASLKIPADLVWVADRSGGRIDMSTPNPGWFDWMIVRAQIGGETVFLDPTDRRLGFGALPPGLEGTEALLYHPRKPEVIRLPVTPFDANRRHARVELALDGEGRLTGTGTLELTGHHAWANMRRESDTETVSDFWQEWLEEALGDFAVDGVEVTETPDERRILVSWTMEQAEEEVLGDESSLRAGRPLALDNNPFAAPRRLPVRFDFADRDEVELSLTWPEGWEVDVLPPQADYSGPAGAFVARVDHQPAERRLTVTRRMDIVEQELASPPLLAAIRELYDIAESADGKSLVLVRR
jgi:transglutaminase-like putative cysteine protease